MDIDRRETHIDGTVDGYTGAQYANAAYRVDNKWHNNAEMKDGGTIRVMKGKVINEGDEILFAYHTNYWSRWGTAQHKRRGRPRRRPLQLQRQARE